MTSGTTLKQNETQSISEKNNLKARTFRKDKGQNTKTSLETPHTSVNTDLHLTLGSNNLIFMGEGAGRCFRALNCFAYAILSCLFICI